MVEEVFVSMGFAALAGATYGFVGYFRNKNQIEVEEEIREFDVKKFSILVVSSAVIGAGASYSGIAPDAFAASAYGVVLTQLVRKLYDVIVLKYSQIMK